MQATHEYHKLLEKILDNGTKKGDRTGYGTISIFSHTLELDMNQGFPLITTKKMFTKGIIGELLWFLNGSKDIRELWENNIRIWDGNWYDQYEKSCSSPYTLEEIKEKVKSGNHSFHDIMFSLGPIYGKQWVDWSGKDEIILGEKSGQYHKFDTIHHYGINQIQNAIETLTNNPDSRRIIVTAWNPSEIEDMALPPCHWAFELYTEELTLEERREWCKNNNIVLEHLEAGLENEEDDMHACGVPKRKLHLKWHQRSVDTFLGLPFNIASYAMLLHMFAQQSNMVPGKLIGDLTNVHIYNNHIELAKEQLDRNPFKYNAPKLELNKAESIFDYKIEDFKIKEYESYPNWKDVVMPV